MINRQVNAEPIPEPAVTIPQVTLEASHQVVGEADVVEPVAAVEGVDSGLRANEPPDHFRILIQNAPGNVLQMAIKKLTAFSHDLPLP
jgi:hypothetical protein